MENRGLKQKDLAKGAGLSAAAVNKYFKKGTLPGMEELTRIARFLGVTADYFIEDWSEVITKALVPAAIREGPPEHLIDDLGAEMDALREQLAATERAFSRLRGKSGKGSVSSDAKRIAKRAMEMEGE